MNTYLLTVLVLLCHTLTRSRKLFLLGVEDSFDWMIGDSPSLSTVDVFDDDGSHWMEQKELGTEHDICCRLYGVLLFLF